MNTFNNQNLLKEKIKLNFSEKEFEIIKKTELILTNAKNQKINDIFPLSEIIKKYKLNETEIAKLNSHGLISRVQYYKCGLAKNNQSSSNLNYIKEIIIFIDTNKSLNTIIKQLNENFKSIFAGKK